MSAVDVGPHPADSHGVVVAEATIRYGSLTAVDSAGFRAIPGEITVVLGPNGAGKTSLVEHLEGYRRIDSGRTSVLGLDPIADHHRLSGQVGVMLQSGGIPTGIRPLELLRQYAGFFPEPLDPQLLLDRVGLTGRTRSTYRRLSGGEQQRLSLALALIGRPRVVFLDEPSAGVDLQGRDQIRAVVSELRDDDVCVVLTTHDLEEAERVADRIVIMDRGRVVADGTPAELVAGRGDEQLRFAAPPGLDATAMATAIGHPVVEESPGEYRVAAAPTPATVAAVTSWLARHDHQLHDLRAERQRLDDVFRRLTAGGGRSDGEHRSDDDAETGRGRRQRPGRGGRRGAR